MQTARNFKSLPTSRAMAARRIGGFNEIRQIVDVETEEFQTANGETVASPFRNTPEHLQPSPE